VKKSPTIPCVLFVLFSRTFLFVFPLQLFVGVLLSTQPFFLTGIEDEEKAKGSAFGAAGTFAVTFFASLGGVWYDSIHKKEPAAEGEEPESGYHLSQDQPISYGTSA
jgi:hypothetical protein